jgi:hypothetical protein
MDILYRSIDIIMILFMCRDNMLICMYVNMSSVYLGDVIHSYVKELCIQGGAPKIAKLNNNSNN